jgi:hypothetical protein
VICSCDISARRPGRPPLYCVSCRKAERKRKYYRYQPAPPKTKQCVICDETFRTKGRGRSPSACWLHRDDLRREQRRNARNARRARKGKVIGDITTTDLISIRSKQRDTCACCESRLHSGGHLDHIVQLHLGGTHTKDNVRFLCSDCNLTRPKKDHSDIGAFQFNLWMQDVLTVACLSTSQKKRVPCLGCAADVSKGRRVRDYLYCFDCKPAFEQLRSNERCDDCGANVPTSRRRQGDMHCWQCKPKYFDRVMPDKPKKLSYDGKHDMGTVVMLRRCGDGYKRIAKALGVSRGTARELVKRAEAIGWGAA